MVRVRRNRLAGPAGLLLTAIGVVLAVGANAATTAPSSSALSPARFSAISSGVVLIETTGCGGKAGSLGSGFLVGTSVVMTARHVLEGSCGSRVNVDGEWISGGRWTSWYGKSIGTTKTADIATLKLASPSAGHVFAFRTTPLPIGANVAMAGHPLGNQIQLTQGPVLSHQPVNGVPTIAIRLLGAEGASGSPFLDNNGEVVGILQRGAGSKDALGQNTGGLVFGLDLADGGWSADLCHSYPRGGIPDCQPPSPAKPKPVSPKPAACERKPYADCAGADLSEQIFVRANLHGITLHDANAHLANFFHANLFRANLRGANLTGTNLEGANLGGADLTGADLGGANLFRANLGGANLYDADLTGANLTGADLTRAHLDGANLSGATLTSANLTGADLSYGNLTDAQFTRTKLTRADLSYATGADLTGAIFSNTTCPNGTITNTGC